MTRVLLGNYGQYITHGVNPPVLTLDVKHVASAMHLEALAKRSDLTEMRDVNRDGDSSRANGEPMVNNNGQ